MFVCVFVCSGMLPNWFHSDSWVTTHAIAELAILSKVDVIVYFIFERFANELKLNFCVLMSWLRAMPELSIVAQQSFCQAHKTAEIATANKTSTRINKKNQSVNQSLNFFRCTSDGLSTSRQPRWNAFPPEKWNSTERCKLRMPESIFRFILQNDRYGRQMEHNSRRKFANRVSLNSIASESWGFVAIDSKI